MHFQTFHLEDMGEAFCKALLDYCDPDYHKLQSVYRELELMFPPRVSSLVCTYSSVDCSSQNSKLSDLSRDPSVHGAHGLGFIDAGSDEDTDADSDVENGKGRKERRRRNSTKKAGGATGGARAAKGANGSGKAKTSQLKGKSALPKSSAVKRSEGPASKKTKSKPSQKQGFSEDEVDGPGGCEEKTAVTGGGPGQGRVQQDFREGEGWRAWERQQ